MLDDIASRLRTDGVEILAVSVDQERENVVKFLGARGHWALTIAHDPKGEIADRLQPEKMPTSYIIDRQGIIRYMNYGFVPSDAPAIERRLADSRRRRQTPRRRSRCRSGSPSRAAQPRSYSSWRRHQTPVSLRPAGRGRATGTCPRGCRAARVGGVGVVDDAVFEHERAHARPLAREGGGIGSGHAPRSRATAPSAPRAAASAWPLAPVVVFEAALALLLLGEPTR